MIILIFIVIVWLLFYTPILNKILFPNGKTAFSIIHKLACKDFGKDIDKCKNFLELKNSIIISLKRMKVQEFEENELSILVDIEHINQNDFGNYMSLKFAYWAIILATISTIYNGNIFEFFGLNKIQSISVTVMVFTIFLLIMGNTVRKQHNQLEYLKFKLLCINEVKNHNEKKIQNINNKKQDKY